MDDAMDGPMDGAMDSGARGEARDTASPDYDPREARDPSPPLTHRPRAIARLTPSAIATPPRRSASAPGGYQAPEKAPEKAPEQDPQPARVQSPAPPRDRRAADLSTFADQLIAIAEQLRAGGLPSGAALRPVVCESLSEPVSAAGPADASNPSAFGGACGETGGMAGGRDTAHTSARKAYAEMARVSYARRRKRATIFGDSELFGEPAWDILLDLYIAQAENKPVSVSSACIGSAAPPTTGLRWLGVLADHGLVEREHDPHDQRRVLVRLTEKALDAMDDYFACSQGMTADRRSARG